MIPLRAHLGAAADELASLERLSADPRLAELDALTAQIDSLADTVARLGEPAASRAENLPDDTGEPTSPQTEPSVGRAEPLILPRCTGQVKVFVSTTEVVLQLELADRNVPLLIPFEVGALGNLMHAVADAITDLVAKTGDET